MNATETVVAGDDFDFDELYESWLDHQRELHDCDCSFEAAYQFTEER